MLPLWLSPTQIRLIPISDAYLTKVVELSKEIASQNIRVDIDDRASTLQKKVRGAEKEWIPYIIVVGQKEVDSGILSVRDRNSNGKVEKLKLEKLINTIKTQIQNKPFKPLSLPINLTKRPQFYG